MPRRATTALLLLCVLVPASAFAGGFEIPDNGTRALGRAGAYVAGADEPSAIYYNPAALTRTSGTAVTANFHLLDHTARFERSPLVWFENDRETDRNRRELQYDPVEQSNSAFPAPMLFVASDLGLDDWVFGLGVYGPSAYGTGRYPEMERALDPDDEICGVISPCRDSGDGENVAVRDGGQAYMMYDQLILLIYPSFSLARSFEDIGLSVGVTFQLALLSVDFSVGIDGDASQNTDVETESREKEDFFTPVTLHVTDIGATGILGLLWEINDRWSIGASYRPQFRLRGEGDVDIEFPSGLSGAELSLEPRDASLRIRMPDVVRAGVQYQHRNEAGRELFDVELDVVWENWSVLDGFDVIVPGRVNDILGTLQDRAIGDLFLGRYYQDAVSVRLGSDLSFLRDAETGKGFIFRLGGLFETPSSPEEWTNIDFLPFLRVAGSAGVSYHLQRVSFDLGYEYLWSPDRTVDDGQYDILVPLWVCNDRSNPNYPTEACDNPSEPLNPAHAANNGDYETWAQVFSVGMTYGW